MKINWKENIKKYLLNIFEKNNSKKLFSILIWKPIVYYFWEKFAEDFMNNRVEKWIFLKSLRLTKENFDTKIHKNYSWYNKEIKHIESDIFKQNTFLYWTEILEFDMEKFELTIINNQNIYNQKLKIFNKLWYEK